MPKVHKVKKPEGGGEFYFVAETHHDCDAAQAVIRETGNEDCDLLVFPVGLHGFEMPNNIPFPVTALEPCGVCGRTLTGMWMWEGSSIFIPGVN